MVARVVLSNGPSFINSHKLDTSSDSKSNVTSPSIMVCVMNEAGASAPRDSKAESTHGSRFKP